MKIYKMLFFSSMILGTMISISSNSWFGMWIGVEINLISIIPLMNQKGNSMATEAMIKYFITQALASSIFLMAIIMLMVNTQLHMTLESKFIMMMNSSLLTKMGAAPFHFWFPEVMEGLSWLNCLLLSTWQKLAPMVLIMYTMNSLFISLIILTSMVVSALMGMNQKSLRKIMAYSSINHLGWMLSTLMLSETIWMFYFITYSLINLSIMVTFNETNVSSISQLSQKLNMSPLNKMFFMLNFFNLMGIPPFLGFMPKWLTFQVLISQNFYLLLAMMIILTLIMVYVYFRVLSTSLIMKTQELSMNLDKSEQVTLPTLNFLVISGLLMATQMFNWT